MAEVGIGYPHGAADDEVSCFDVSIWPVLTYVSEALFRPQLLLLCKKNTHDREAGAQLTQLGTKPTRYPQNLPPLATWWLSSPSSDSPSCPEPSSSK